MRKLMLLALVAACGAPPANSQEETPAAYAAAEQAASPDEVLAAIRAFDSAVAAGDTATAIDLLHPDLLVYESGTVDDSKEHFVADHLPADIEVMKNSTMTGEEPTIVMAESGDLAVATSTYHLVGSYKDRKIDSNGAATMVLARTADGWKIRHIHYSSRARD